MGFIVKAFKSVVKTVIGVVSKVAGAIFGFSVSSGSKKAKTANTLNKSLEPETYRKIVFGKTAAPLDVRFWEVWGAKGTNFDEVIALATHQIHSVLELYFEQDLAVSAAGAVQAKYAGILTRTVKLGAPNQTALAVGAQAQWTAAATFDGCPHMKLAWLPDEKRLPNGIPNRYTQIVEGALVYDPRRDSTVAGGSGTHRANDRTTWAYATLDANGQPIGRNNALQALWYLLGWFIPTKNSAGTVIGDMLVAGRGVDIQDINLASFIAGANACEVAGYYTDLTLSTEDNHTSNEDKITCDGLIARLIDPGGLWSYYANVDDTANIALELTDADIIEGSSVSWNEYKGMSDQFNQVSGKFINPSNITLFQPFPYPMVRDATYETNLGVKRKKTQDFQQILDSTVAQRLARLLLNQGQYQGEFSAGFNYRSVKAQAWSIVRYTSERFGWTKLFRVWRHEISTNGGVSMLLKEVHASIWSAGTVTPPLAPGAGVPYDPSLAVSAEGVAVTLAPMTGAGGTLGDGFRLSWTAPPANVRRSEIRYRVVGTSSWLTAGPVDRDVTSVLVGPLFSGAFYETAIRHISIHEITGLWIAPANFTLGSTGNVNAAAILDASETALWSEIVGTGKPEDSADVTMLVTPATAIMEILADVGGTVKTNQLPKTASFRLIRALGTDVTTEATWTSLTLSGTVTHSIGSNTGVLSVNTLSTSSAKIKVTATRNGIARTAELTINRKDDVAVVSGGGGGAGDFPTSNSDATLGSIAVDVYSTPQGGPIAVEATASGSVALTAALTLYGPSSGSYTITTAGKWQWRVVGGAWADVAAEISSIQSTFRSAGDPPFEPIEYDEGYLNVNQTKSGLTSGLDYEFQLLLRRTSGAALTVTVDGSANVNPN